MLASWPSLLVTFALLAPALAALATDGTVTVNGEVVVQTCTVNGGSPSFSVAMPLLSTAALAGVGSTAGATRFAVVLSDCEGSATTATTYFEAGPTVNAAGRLSNQAVAGASVDGQLRNGDGSVINLAGAIGLQNVNPSLILGRGASQSFSIAYFSNAATATAGAFNSSVVYTLVYQ